MLRVVSNAAVMNLAPIVVERMKSYVKFVRPPSIAAYRPITSHGPANLFGKAIHTI